MSTITQQIIQDVEKLPEALQSEILDFVHFLKHKENKKTEHNKIKHVDKLSGEAMADVLDEASKHNLFSNIEDPVEWQREIRKDRPLNGREE
jgi:predicted class III extradiol MEMO1 family dioxygenase